MKKFYQTQESSILGFFAHIFMFLDFCLCKTSEKTNEKIPTKTGDIRRTYGWADEGT